MITTDNRPAQLSQLSDRLTDLHQLTTTELTDVLETILHLYSHANRILSELNDRAPDSEIRICCDSFNDVPMSVFARLGQYL
jgi:hypothetical protein